MLASIKRTWHGLERSKPGRRFQNRYVAAHRKGRKASTIIGRVVRFVIALIAIFLGIVFAFIPGPAFVFFALAGALLATESRRVAAGLDWTEVKLRALGRRARRRWGVMSWFGRAAVVTTFAVGALGFGALSIWFSFLR